MKYKIKVDENLCIGCGSCAAICPEAFQIDDNGKSKPIKEEVLELGCAKTSEESCPVKAIIVDSVK